MKLYSFKLDKLYLIDIYNADHRQPHAQKEIDALGATARRLVVEKIAAYVEEPAALANNVKRLRGSGLIRLRVGDYRVIFAIEGETMTILTVAHRREAYD